MTIQTLAEQKALIARSMFVRFIRTTLSSEAH